MNKEQTISNMSAMIKSLSEENAALKEKVAALTLTLELSEQGHANSLNKAKEIIEECTPLAKQYQEAIVGARTAKRQYQEAARELYALIQEYQKKMEKLIKQI